MICLGCCNGLSMCPTEHQWNFKGTIDTLGIFLYDVLVEDRIEFSQIGKKRIDKNGIPQFTYGKSLESFFNGAHQDGDFDYREIIF